MPRLSVWTIRLALLHFATAVTFGALMLFEKGISYYPPIWRLRALHIDLALVGWLVQLALGMAYWILPRWYTQRGNVGLAVAAVVLLNLGLLVLTVVAVLPGLLPPAWLHPASLIGRTSHLLALACFALHAYPRIKPAGA